MKGLRGFLVVRAPDTGMRYRGVDRVPPYPTDDESERAALEEYVLGDHKDDTTNLIPSIDDAVRLQRSLSSRAGKYEVLFCCENPDIVRTMEWGGVDIEQLGYDVAAIRADYWSIVSDLSKNEWASKFRSRLNEFGLFAGRADAEAYLREYRERREPDSDSPFDVVYVFRVDDQKIVHHERKS